MAGDKKTITIQRAKFNKNFILPPNKLELEKRLINRNQDTNQTVDQRLKQYESDIKHWHDYDYIVINNDLGTCFNQIEKIIKKHKQKNQLFPDISS